MNELIILGGSLTALALIRDAHRLGLNVTVLCAPEQIAGLSRLATQIAVDERDDAALREAIGKLPNVRSSALICDSDRMLRFLRRQRAWIDAHVGQVLHPGDDALEICLDKAACGWWCRAQEIPTPITYEVDDALTRVSPPPEFPILIRPEETQHGSGRDVPKAMELHNDDDLAIVLARFRAADVRPVVNESLLCVGLRQFSIGVARRADGETRSVCVEKLRPLPHHCAAGSYVRTVDAPAARDLALNAIDALDYIGIAELEILHDPNTGRHHLIEINARPWAQYPIAARAGVDLLGFLLDRERNPGRPSRATWIDFGADLHFAFSDQGVVRGREMSLFTWLGSVLRANCYAYWDSQDRAPFWHQTRNLMTQIFKALF
ncbi:MAG: hypothetical protein H6981_11085 [Gammaproteobacteria bacterium]|nr:hypothetical protein [Gammaproteobacteria bacterium]MCP5137330.1 hypothetical protein [Gammaproteobacteria bacterium]